MSNYTLLIECSDRVGLVHGVTGVLYRHGVNIIENQEFVDRQHRHFFMRTEFSGAIELQRAEAELTEILPPAATIRLLPQREKKIVVMVTREHHCLGDLLIRHAFKELHASIQAVIGNHDNLRTLVEHFEIPFHHLSHEGLNRVEHERLVLATLRQYPCDYLVLAKYMRILSPEFVQAYSGRAINIHHSFLPAFVGANPYRQAYRRGVKIVGATAHFVTEDLDEGPIVAQDVIAVDHTLNAAGMAQAGRDVEKITLVRALKSIFENRVFVYGNRTVVFK